MSHNQFSLLKEKRFLPFFITQALGALNDNVFKTALMLLISHKAASQLPFSSDIAVNIAAILFIFPFFIFSSTAGQIAEKYEKSFTIRKIKLAEIIIMLLAVVGIYLENIPALLFILFLMGFQSAIFGPIKYGLLPQHLHTDELVGGNALVESSTFVAILIGTIFGTAVMTLGDNWALPLAIALLLVSITGYIASRSIPETPAVEPMLKINWNVFTEIHRNFKFMASNQVVFLAVIGISWFWFYGAVYLTQIPNYAKSTLAGDESVVGLLLTALTLGIAIGSMLCEKLSAGRVEVGLVPIGAFGLSFFGYDLYLANTASQLTAQFNFQQLLEQPETWRVLIDAMLIGAFGGLFTVPLYALIQKEGDRKHMSRLIAGLNIMNALFMVFSGLFAIALLNYGLTIPELFLTTAMVNLIIAFYIFIKSPEFFIRFVIWLLVNTIYRIKNTNMDVIPKHGACVLVCNHVSFIDALIIGGYSKRNVRFVMHHTIFKMPIIGSFFKLANAIPIAPAHEDHDLMNQAFDKIASELEKGEVVCIFPEGKLTSNGEINEFKSGIEKIIERTPVPVIPMALIGLWGSWFSRFNGKAMTGLPKKFMAKVKLIAGPAILPELVTAKLLFEKVSMLKESNT